MPETEKNADLRKSFAEQFHEAFPMYLAMGMTYDEFWNQDCTLTVAYRRAEEIRNDKRNQELWLQGMYIYEALCDVAPIFRSFGKKGTKPGKYPTEPYSLTTKAKQEHDERQSRQVFNKGLALMEALMKTQNEKFKSKEQEVSANADKH